MRGVWVALLGAALLLATVAHAGPKTVTWIVRTDAGTRAVAAQRRGALEVLGERGAIALVNAAKPAAIDGETLESVDALERRVADALPAIDRGELHVRAVLLPVARRRLGVVVWYDGVQRGLLRSPTTRTRGLIAAEDLVPGARPLTARPVPDPWSALRSLEARVDRVEAATGPVLSVYGGVAGALVVGAVAVALGPWTGRRLRVLARAGLRAAGAGPLLLCFVPAWTTTPLAYGIAAAALLAFGAVPIRVGMAILAATVAADTVGNAGLVAFSPLSGYHLAGIRYYGVGNEYMAFLLSAVLVCVPGPWMAGALFGAGALLGAPTLGANAGGAMSAAAGWAAWLLEARGRLRGPWLAAPLAAAVAAAVGVALWDRAMPDEARSHIGRAVADGERGGAAVLVRIALRKLAMNLRIAVTPGGLAAFAGGIPLLWFLARHPAAERVRAAVAADPDLRARLRVGAATAVAIAAFNDSGLVAAILLVAPLLGAVVERTLSETDP